MFEYQKEKCLKKFINVHNCLLEITIKMINIIQSNIYFPTWSADFNMNLFN